MLLIFPKFSVKLYKDNQDVAILKLIRQAFSKNDWQRGYPQTLLDNATKSIIEISNPRWA